MGKEQTARVRRVVVRAITTSAAVTLTSTIFVFPLLGESVSVIASGSLSYAVLGVYGGRTAFVAALAARAAVRAVRRAAERTQTVYGRASPEDFAELTESRHEIVTVFETKRHHIERDLHDDTQQYPVAALIGVGEADLLLGLATADGAVTPKKVAEIRTLLGEAQDDAESALRALKDTVAGIHSKMLSDLGLEAAVRSFAASSPLRVEIFVPNRFPAISEGVIAATYFLASEGLANAAKYASAARVSVLLVADEDLHVSVSGDSPGGTSMRPGHGLFGMHERPTAFGDILEAVSPPGGPTILMGRIPLLLWQGEFGVVPAKSHEGVGETDGGTGVGEAGDDAGGNTPETRRVAKADWRSSGEKAQKEW